MTWLIWESHILLSDGQVVFCFCPGLSLVGDLGETYRNFPKYSDTQKICCNHSKIWTIGLYHRVMSPNNADGMANSVDPDQTAPLGAVWSGSALFAQAYLSENLGSLRYLPNLAHFSFWAGGEV